MIEKAVSQLVQYAVCKHWIKERDRLWVSNLILDAIGAKSFDGLVCVEKLPPIQQILDRLCDLAGANGIIDCNSIAERDLFDTKLMGLIMPRPSEICEKFFELYEQKGAEAATDYYYQLSKDSNYIRCDRIAKDKKWTVPTQYGELDITINLSKPEKDPKAIAAAGKSKAVGYPKCLLCAENEGYAGHLNHPARQNHRIIPLTLGGKSFFLQYSPYVYFNEHCILLNAEHTPMKIERQTFENLLDFVTLFPHYTAGSNADLPIVGGSVLSHDHYQGGRYIFPMERAKIERSFRIAGFEEVDAGILRWPMSVIRLSCKCKEKLLELAEHILNKWRCYDDADAFIFHETEGEPHSTITPIARRHGELYELDLVLRNNITTTQYPLGVFHPHSEKHHIKKENIGLIEVMGLAVLPARLDKELTALAVKMLDGSDPAADELTAKHADWAREIRQRHPELSAQNVEDILKLEVGMVFSEVLEDAGVFKRNDDGQAAFLRFIQALS